MRRRRRVAAAGTREAACRRCWSCAAVSGGTRVTCRAQGLHSALEQASCLPCQLPACNRTLLAPRPYPAAAPLAERYVKYHEEWLKRCLLKIFSAPPRSGGWGRRGRGSREAPALQPPKHWPTTDSWLCSVPALVNPAPCPPPAPPSVHPQWSASISAWQRCASATRACGRRAPVRYPTRQASTSAGQGWARQSFPHAACVQASCPACSAGWHSPLKRSSALHQPCLPAPTAACPQLCGCLRRRRRSRGGMSTWAARQAMLHPAGRACLPASRLCPPPSLSLLVVAQLAHSPLCAGPACPLHSPLCAGTACQQMVGSSCALAGGVQEGGEGHLGGGQQVGEAACMHGQPVHPVLWSHPCAWCRVESVPPPSSASRPHPAGCAVCF